MSIKKIIAGGFLYLLVFHAQAAQARNYVQSLVGDLIEIGYQISSEDVVALDKIAMRFDSRNRLDVLKKILSDRDTIHGIEGANYYTKTEAIRNALRLLDEHNLPETDALIKVLIHEGGWEKREKALLSYMAAKRSIEYQPNVDYLLSELSRNEGGPVLNTGTVSVEILDFCDILFYLSDIFAHTGDVNIFNTLIRYAERGSGYPVEYFSRLLVNMFLHQPKAFVSNLSGKDNRTINAIIDSMVFGIWNNQQKENVLESIRDELVLENESEKRVIALLTEKIGGRFPSGSTGGTVSPDSGSEE